ncbi:KRI1-like family C-terminal domain containing protein [Elaphomyces granulatus]|jgi:protein KRI1
MEPPAKRPRKLLDISSSDSESEDGAGGVRLNGGDLPALKINEEYARRFEYNKKREELQQLEAKLGKTSSLGKRIRKDNGSDDEEEHSESTSDSEEDEDGVLATKALDSEILATLSAIQSKDPRVYDKGATFYSDFKEDEQADQLEKKEKPIYLRDYHRTNLLSGLKGEEIEEAAPKTFAQEQEELKKAVVREIDAAVNDQNSSDESEDSDFLIPKSTPIPLRGAKPDIRLDVENAHKDPERFLTEFMTSRAWVPTAKSKYQPFESDDDGEDERAEAFEEAYNFRFEDPNKINEKLIGHARDTTSKFSVRREEKNSRKRQREAEHLKKEEEKKQRDFEKNRLRKLKMEELEEKITKIKHNAGINAADITDEAWARFLDEKWDDEKWEKEMQKRFGDEYYAQEDGGPSGDEEDGGREKERLKKPTWDDDIDIKDLIPDFQDKELSESDANADVDEETQDGSLESMSKSRAQAKRDKKRESRKERRLIEEAVDRNLDLEPTLMAGATRKNATHFRYRETSPQSFGLTARDILMADDTQLNQFVGLKKLAAFRDPEKKRRDAQKMGKKARLRQWRKDTFGNEKGPSLDFSPQQESNPSIAAKGDEVGEIKVDIREGGPRGKRKRSKKH